MSNGNANDEAFSRMKNEAKEEKYREGWATGESRFCGNCRFTPRRRVHGCVKHPTNSHQSPQRVLLAAAQGYWPKKLLPSSRTSIDRFLHFGTQRHLLENNFNANSEAKR